MKMRASKNHGFSLIELLIAMTVMLIALGIVSSVMARAMSTRARESRTADALATAQAAIGVLSREISNSGFGLYQAATGPTARTASNGIVLSESNDHRIRIRSNIDHAGGTYEAQGPTTLYINRPGEDVTYFFDAATSSIVRYDRYAIPNGSGGFDPQTSVVVNRISNVTFEYYDYAGGTSQASAASTTPTVDTARVRIIVNVDLDPVSGQRNPERITFASDVTLRNNSYMLSQY